MPFSDYSTLVVGDAMLDRYWFGDANRISPEAPVPVVKIERVEERLGGAANVALNVASLGMRSSLLSIIGDDADGTRIEELLVRSGVNSALQRDSRLRTTVKLRIIARQQQMLRADFEEWPTDLVLDRHLDVFQKLLPSQNAVILSDYGKGGLDRIKAMISMASEQKLPILVDPKGSDYSRYKHATVITPNRSELASVIGKWSCEEQLHERAQNLREELCLSALLLTRSEEGMTLFSDEGAYTVPAQAREVYDVSGAGDTVIAVLASMLAAGVPIRKAVGIANRAGGIVVGKFGTASISFSELFPEGIVK